MTYSVLGTCGNCGGPVVARIGREGVNINPKCIRCQSRPADEFGPVVPMVALPARVVIKTSTGTT